MYNAQIPIKNLEIEEKSRIVNIWVGYDIFIVFGGGDDLWTKKYNLLKYLISGPGLIGRGRSSWDHGRLTVSLKDESERRKMLKSFKTDESVRTPS